MRITHFEHSELCSIGLAVDEGLAYRFLATNDIGSIEEWHEKVDGEWQVVTGPPPAHLRNLVAVKCADERRRHGEGPAVVDLRARL